MTSTLEERIDSIINKLSPKQKLYKVSVERQVSEIFNYEIRAFNEDEAEEKARENAYDEDDYNANIETYINSISCDDEADTVEESITDPNQISIFNINSQDSINS